MNLCKALENRGQISRHTKLTHLNVNECVWMWTHFDNSMPETSCWWPLFIWLKLMSLDRQFRWWPRDLMGMKAIVLLFTLTCYHKYFIHCCPCAAPAPSSCLSPWTWFQQHKPRSVVVRWCDLAAADQPKKISMPTCQSPSIIILLLVSTSTRCLLGQLTSDFFFCLHYHFHLWFEYAKFITKHSQCWIEATWLLFGTCLLFRSCHFHNCVSFGSMDFYKKPWVQFRLC